MQNEEVTTIRDISKIMKSDHPVIRGVPFKNYIYDMRVTFVRSYLATEFTYDDFNIHYRAIKAY